MVTEVSVELSKTRGIVYQWLSNMILIEPNEQNFQTYVHDDVIDSIKEMLEDKDYGNTIIQEMVKWRDTDEYKEKMVIDFNDLFHVPGPKYLYPFESCYRERLVEEAIGKVYGCSTIEVNHLYKTANISFDKQEVPDHIGLELLFMSELCKLESENLENAQVDVAKIYKGWQKGFLNDHLFQWGFEVLENMQEKAESDFYRCIAQMLTDFLKEEKTFFSI